MGLEFSHGPLSVSLSRSLRPLGTPNLANSQPMSRERPLHKRCTGTDGLIEPQPVGVGGARPFLGASLTLPLHTSGRPSGPVLSGDNNMLASVS